MGPFPRVFFKKGIMPFVLISPKGRFLE